MAKKTLGQRLNQSAGLGDIKFLIPRIFVPPRFRKLSEGRDMLIIMDEDSVIHIDWEGCRLEVYEPITPGAARRLIKECLRNMSRYRKDLTILGRFLDREAEKPFWDVREYAPEELSDRPAESRVLRKIPAPKEILRVPLSRSTEEMGGESPLPLETPF